MAGDETLQALLDRVRLTEGAGREDRSAGPPSAESGMWAVSWAQGAVAAGATQVSFDFRGRGAEVRVYGPVGANAQEMVEALLANRAGETAAERYWLSALREAPSSRFKVLTRHGAYRQMAKVAGGKAELSIGEYRGEAVPLSLRMDAPKGRSLLRPWIPESEALSRFRYCPTPIMLAGQVASGLSPYKQAGSLMSWTEPASNDEPGFAVRGDPRQILAPHLIKTHDSSPSLRRCALLMTLSRVPKEAGRARVWWMRDGALLGPVRIVGPTGVLAIEVVCPGDYPGDFGDWALRDPARFFPQSRVLAVARRLASGLESLLPQLGYRSNPVDDLLRRASEMPRLSQLVPLGGKPHIALSGAFFQCLKAFSLRRGLELEA